MQGPEEKGGGIRLALHTLGELGERLGGVKGGVTLVEVLHKEKMGCEGGDHGSQKNRSQAHKQRVNSTRPG